MKFLKKVCMCFSAFFILAVLLGCSQNLVGNTSETGNPAIMGILYDQDGVTPAAGATIRLLDVRHVPSLSPNRAKTSAIKPGSDITTTTDKNGVYRFLRKQVPDSGVFNIFGETDAGLVMFHDSVAVLSGDTADVGVDTAQLPGEIRGYSLLPGQNDTNQVRVTIYAPGTQFITKPIVGGYFSFTRVPPGTYHLIFDPTLNEYHVRILQVSVLPDMIVDLDTVVLYSDSITGAPTVNAGVDTTVSINDTIRLHGNAYDPYGTIVSMEWDIGATGNFVHTASGDTTFTAGSQEDTLFACILRATDNDSTVNADTVRIKILKDAPLLSLGNDTTIGVNTQLSLRAQVTNTFGSIVMYSWDRDGNGTWDDSGSVDSVAAKTFDSRGRQTVICQVRDDDGNTALDSIAVVVASIVSGELPGDTTFTESKSPYFVEGYVLVKSTNTLCIEPGVEIRFAPGAIMKVEGHLSAEGTVDSMIVFTSNSPDPKPGDWQGISVSGLSVVLKCCEIRYAVDGLFRSGFGGQVGIDSCAFLYNLGAGIYLDGSISYLRVLNSVFSGCDYGIQGRSSQAGTVRFINNLISENKTGGLYWQGQSSIDVLNNTITRNGLGKKREGNFNAGMNIVWLGDSMAINKNLITENAVGVVGNYSFGLEMNNIFANSTYDMVSSTIQNMDIPGNWWGTTDTTEIDIKIYDRKDNFNLGRIDVTPVLISPVPDAGRQEY